MIIKNELSMNKNSINKLFIRYSSYSIWHIKVFVSFIICINTSLYISFASSFKQTFRLYTLYGLQWQQWIPLETLFSFLLSLSLSLSFYFALNNLCVFTLHREMCTGCNLIGWTKQKEKSTKAYCEKPAPKCAVFYFMLWMRIFSDR